MQVPVANIPSGTFEVMHLGHKYRAEFSGGIVTMYHYLDKDGVWRFGDHRPTRIRTGHVFGDTNTLRFCQDLEQAVLAVPDLWPQMRVS